MEWGPEPGLPILNSQSHSSPTSVTTHKPCGPGYIGQRSGLRFLYCKKGGKGKEIKEG